MVAPAEAQLNTQHIKGTVGLKSGSQAPPGVYFIAPLFYVYKADEVKDRDGARGPFGADLTTQIYGGGINVVTKGKLFGGLYGFQVVFPVGANNRIQGTEIDANPGAGLSDTAITPMSLGWHANRADATAGYTLFVPTGRYTDGANNNTGLGMWGHELSVGTTVYLSGSRQWHATTLATFDFQSKKEDSETKVGSVMNLEGGLGGDFLRGGLTAGLNYYTSFKLTDDQIEGFPDILIRGKNKVFALGPGSAAGARKKQHALWLPEGELPVGGVRPNHDSGHCADDPCHVSHETAQAFQSLRLSVQAERDQMTGENPMCCTGAVTRFGASVALVALWSAMVMAQDRGQPSFAESQKANAQMLRQYTWRSRTEIKLKGESKNVKLEQVRYDANGTLEKTPIGALAAAAPQAQGNRGGRGGRLKAKVIENKKEEFGELMQGLGQLVASYGHLPPDRLEAFKATATTGRGEGALQGTAQIQGVNVLEQGDSMTIWIDPASKMMRRVEIKTMYDKKPATLVADYQSVPNGPTYMARAVLTYPEENVELTVDNSDYVQGRP